ncbi:PLP-dependent transferase [Jaminaea rosea]|uniref:PLP-dependent transferase n=1 Tax=Jaminaea rosea TaxID=1569628 RepID=A0A316UN43_9BASI|nr:PLP-dependent transferase [Jaminaea rosea]PWN26670.1 PLP-dependent transferase [Jaminaea rosea]
MDLAAPAGLSQRGDKNAAVVNGSLKNLLEIFRDQYDPKTNPSGIVIVGVADNSLMRKEVLRWINSDRLKLQPAELTYGDRIFSSTRLVNALCSLFNEVPMGLDTEKPKLIKQVVPDDIVVGSGATGILDALFTVLCNPGDGVLLSVPSYNGFDHDLTARAEAKIIEVHTPLPEAYDPAHKPQQPSRAFTPDTVKAYEDALAQARKDGVKVTSILVCNPHNPTGLVYPRETLVALAKLAAKESLHLVVDEIYARSVFSSPDISDADATRFHSILTVDVEKEASLPRANVHVVSSISKDFGANGFRLGVYVNQGGQDVVAAMSSLGILSQSSSPAGALWYLWLEDRAKGGFLPYFFAENHRRMTIAYRYLTQWAQRQGIGYVAANSGHFVMLDLRPYLGVKGGDDGDDAARKAETDLSQRFIDARVFVAPGAQYHHPQPGWFRFTFSLELGAVRVGLQRMEKVLGLESQTEAAPDVERDAIPLPPSLQAVVNQDLGAER